MDPDAALLLFLTGFIIVIVFVVFVLGPLVSTFTATVKSIPREDLKSIVNRSLAVIENLGYAYFAWKATTALFHFLLKLVTTLGEDSP